MSDHRVKAPFMSRLGQFEEGKQTLSVGLSVSVLQKEKTINVFLGKSNNYYVIDCVKALEIANNKNSFWTNKQGKSVAIIPLNKFIFVEEVER